MEQFLKLKITPGSMINWVPIFPEIYEESAEVWMRIKKQFP